MSRLDDRDSSVAAYLARFELKQRLIKHYNLVAVQWLDKAIAQANSLKYQRKLLSNKVSLRIV